LIAQDLQGFLLRRDDLAGGLDLGAQRRFLDGGGDHIRGQGDVGRLEREALRIPLRGERLHLPPVGAEHIGHESHGELGGVVIVVKRRGMREVFQVEQGRVEVVAVTLGTGESSTVKLPAIFVRWKL